MSRCSVLSKRNRIGRVKYGADVEVDLECATSGNRLRQCKRDGGALWVVGKVIDVARQFTSGGSVHTLQREEDIASLPIPMKLV